MVLVMSAVVSETVTVATALSQTVVSTVEQMV